MAVRKIPLESGGYIKFENDEEYYVWLQQQEELRKKREEEEEAEEKASMILKAGCFVIVLIFLGIFGLCSSSNKNKEKKVEKTFQTTKRETKTEEQIEQNEQNTSVVVPVQSQNTSVQLDNEIITESDIDVLDETVFEEIEVLDKNVFEEEIEPDYSRQKIYQIVEVDEEPKFPGGEQELMDYISDNTMYPHTAIDEGIQGRVFVSFLVEPNGKVTNVKVLRGIGGGCDEEAVRVVKSLPNWESGIRRGEKVRVAIVVPVKFALE